MVVRKKMSMIVKGVKIPLNRKVDIVRKERTSLKYASSKDLSIMRHLPRKRR